MEEQLKKKFEQLAEEVEKNMANPDVDLEVCFDESCGVPYLIVRYVVEEHSVHEKRMAPVEAYVRVSDQPIYEVGEVVYPNVIMIYHPQVITHGSPTLCPFTLDLRKTELL